MRSVSTADLSQTIGEIYAAAHDPAHWTLAVGAIRRLVDGSKACIVPFGPNCSPDQCLSDVRADDMNLLLLKHYIEDFLPFEARVRSLPLGFVYEDQVVHSVRTPMRETRIWREWMAPQDMYGGIGCRLIDTASSSWHFDVQRGARQPRFEAVELDLIRLLAPHLKQAMTLSIRAGLGARALESLDHLPFGMMLVDAGLRIHQSNARAARLIEDVGSPLSRRSGRLLVVREAGGPEPLCRSILAACPTDRSEPPRPVPDLVLRRSDRPGEGLLVSVSPLGTIGGEHRFAERLVAVAIRPFGREATKEGLEPKLRGAFDLSAREAAITAGLASGLSLRETAERTGIAFSTARSYLETVFAKTDTSRQGELIALVQGLTPLLQGPADA